MWKDPIVEDVRSARDSIAKRFGYDLKRIFTDLRKSEKKRAAAAARRRSDKPAASGKQGSKRGRKAA
jgi:hypothetical protein